MVWSREGQGIECLVEGLVLPCSLVRNMWDKKRIPHSRYLGTNNATWPEIKSL